MHICSDPHRAPACGMSRNADVWKRLMSWGKGQPQYFHDFFNCHSEKELLVTFFTLPKMTQTSSGDCFWGCMEPRSYQRMEMGGKTWDGWKGVIYCKKKGNCWGERKQRGREGEGHLDQCCWVAGGSLAPKSLFLLWVHQLYQGESFHVCENTLKLGKRTARPAWCWISCAVD